MPELENLREAREALLSHFTCQETGKCCEAEGYVYVTDKDISGMAGKLGVSVSDFRAQYVQKDGPWELIASPTFRRRCFLDDQNRCQVYEHRPKYCRDFPHCPEVWQTEADAHSELKKCKGLQLAYEAVFKRPYSPTGESFATETPPEPRS